MREKIGLVVALSPIWVMVLVFIYCTHANNSWRELGYVLLFLAWMLGSIWLGVKIIEGSHRQG